MGRPEKKKGTAGITILSRPFHILQSKGKGKKALIHFAVKKKERPKKKPKEKKKRGESKTRKSHLHTNIKKEGGERNAPSAAYMVTARERREKREKNLDFSSQRKKEASTVPPN